MFCPLLPPLFRHDDMTFHWLPSEFRALPQVYISVPTCSVNLIFQVGDILARLHKVSIKGPRVVHPWTDVVHPVEVHA